MHDSIVPTATRQFSVCKGHLKPVYTFGTETNLKVHRFTNNLQGLKYYSMKCLIFLENIKTILILDSENYGFSLNTCHETAKRRETRVGFLVTFSRLRWPIEPQFSQVFFLYRSCDTQSLGLGQYCLPKGSNGFKRKKNYKSVGNTKF